MISHIMIMNTKILALYRLCVKELVKIKQKDQNIYNTMVSALQGKKNKINEKQSIDLLSSFTKLLTKANQGDQKSIVKLIRVFTNNSQLITPTLDFSQQYGTNAMKTLHQDIEFQQLPEKDKQFVIKVVQKICDKKPTYKYKTVAKYLESISSENVEIQIIQKKDHHQVDENLLKTMSSTSKWGWAYKTLLIKKQDKLSQIIEEMKDRKIFIL